MEVFIQPGKKRQDPVIQQPHTYNGAHTTKRASLMNHPPPIVYTPQPRRSLKRTFLELQENQETCNKRQRVHTFLENIPEPLTRCRSDSYLSSSMSTRPHREIARPVLFDERYTPETPRAQSVQTQVSTQIATTYSTVLASFAPRTPSGSGSSLNISNKRTAQPSYREDLAGNGIRFVGSRQAAPEVLHHAKDIINRARNSPGLSEEQAEAAAVDLEKLRHSGNKVSVIQTLAAHQIVPQKVGPCIERGGNTPFDDRAVPHVQGQPTLATPKPDQYFAYHYDTFSPRQRTLMSDPALYTYSKPVTLGYFPFLTIGYKATARTGSIWIAENEAATSGALCVNSMEHLHEVVEKIPNQIETIAFSCLMDERSATVWMTYCDQMKQHINVEVEQYSMARNNDIIGVRNAIRNICDWGVQERLPNLVSALNRFEPTDLDKDLGTRPSSSVFNCYPLRKGLDRV